MRAASQFTRGTERKSQAPTRSVSNKANTASTSVSSHAELQTQSNTSSKTGVDQIPLGNKQSYSLQAVGKSAPRHSRQGSQQVPLKTGRPEFTAFKQHYSPKKIGKPPSRDQSLGLLTNVDVSGKSLDLQIELAYLHLLHESSRDVHRHWVQSAEQRYESQFKVLVERHGNVKRQQRLQRTQRNEFAASDWVQKFTSLEALRQVKSLSTNISLIFDLLQPNGRFSHAMGLFDSWFTHAEEVRRCRGSNEEDTTPTLDFIEDLGDGWHAEMTHLDRKLNVCARDLYMLDDAKSNSDLAQIITLCRTAAEGMLDEVRLTQVIEQGIMSQEREWISNGIGNLV